MEPLCSQVDYSCHSQFICDKPPLSLLNILAPYNLQSGYNLQKICPLTLRLILGPVEKNQCVEAWIMNCIQLESWLGLRLLRGTCTVVSRKYTPPFATLALVQNAGGGLYAGCDNFSRDYALPSDKAWLHCYLSVGGGGQARGIPECEAERCSRH